MKFRIAFGLIIFIIALIGMFVGLPYLFGIIQSNQIFNFSFPQIIRTSTPGYYYNNNQSQTYSPGSYYSNSSGENNHASQISVGISNYGSGQVTLSTSYFNRGLVNITGWKIKSYQKVETLIGKGYAVPQVDAALSDIWIGNGESANVIAGISPLAGNFRVNKCFGWLKNIYSGMSYSMGYCPAIQYRDLNGLDNACKDLLLRSSCSAPSDDILNKQTSNCKIWAEKNLNYSACVAKYRNDPDFFRGWQIYTGNGYPIIDPSHDKIELYDRNGSLIDSQEY